MSQKFKNRDKRTDNYLASGHVWQTDSDGYVDVWCLDSDIHNGPRCVNCGYNPCMHCRRDNLKPCTPAVRGK